MNEQERFQEAIYNLRFAKACDLHGHKSAIVGIDLLDEAANLLEAALREKQERENPKPKTCDGCRLDKARKIMPLDVMDRCQKCLRLPTRYDAHEPKGVRDGKTIR